ncbi:MAG: Bax inhibitor-1 family protein [Acidimicrobiales bacterium]|nr:Bax inhibitor-1 family protein [Acidimicrobiales bacterium]
MQSFRTPQPAPHSVASLDAEARGEFVIKVYQHLLLAITAFIGFEAILFTTGAAEGLFDLLFASGNGTTWLLVLGGFMVVNWMASSAAHRIDNVGLQYAGLFGLAGAEALIFAPFLYLVFNDVDNGGTTVAAAAALTAFMFTGLSIIAFTTRKDLSFLRPILMWGGFAAIGLIVGALIFGLSLGIWFSVAMIALAGGAILYQTQAIMARYPSEAYVGAAVQLFASVMLLFWYVLRLLTALRN